MIRTLASFNPGYGLKQNENEVVIFQFYNKIIIRQTEVSRSYIQKFYDMTSLRGDLLVRV